jgi:anti-sigma factor RsiW
MNLFSKHITFETLANLAEGRASTAEREANRQHLAECSTCAGELHHLQDVMGLMRTDKSQDAPRDVLNYAITLFQQKPAREPSLIRRLVATLTFDSMTTAPAFGVRSGQTQSRQLLFSAEENDIDLRITSVNNEWIVTGQILRPDCVGGRVEMEGATGAAAAVLNELCEFTLPAVPAGNYSLRVKMADIEVEVPELQLQRQ